MPGHGHVTPNPDGSKARCGGPGICPECSREAITEKRPADGHKFSERETAASMTLHQHGLALFPNGNPGHIEPGYTLASFDAASRQADGRRFGSIELLEAFVGQLASPQPAPETGKQPTAGVMTVHAKTPDGNRPCVVEFDAGGHSPMEIYEALERMLAAWPDARVPLKTGRSIADGSCS